MIFDKILVPSKRRGRKLADLIRRLLFVGRKEHEMKIIPASLILCLLSFTAVAQEADSFDDQSEVSSGIENLKVYLALKGGVSKFDLDGLDYNKLGTYGAAIGVRINPQVRVEFEALSYETIKDSSFSASLKHETLSLMGHLLYDIGNGKIRPYVGAGVGFAVMYDKKTSVRSPYYIEVKETVSGFAAALQAGVSAELSEKAALDVGARYTYMYRPEGDWISSYDTNVFTGLVSLRFNF